MNKMNRTDFPHSAKQSMKVVLLVQDFPAAHLQPKPNSKMFLTTDYTDKTDYTDDAPPFWDLSV